MQFVVLLSLVIGVIGVMMMDFLVDILVCELALKRRKELALKPSVNLRFVQITTLLLFHLLCTYICLPTCD